MQGGADRRAEQKEDQEPQRTEAARNRRPKSEQPDAVEAEMHEIAVDEGVGQERPDRSAPARHPPKLGQKLHIVARWNKRKQDQKIAGLLRRERKRGQGMNEAHRGQERQHHDRNVEDAFAGRVFAGWMHESFQVR